MLSVRSRGALLWNLGTSICRVVRGIEPSPVVGEMGAFRLRLAGRHQGSTREVENYVSFNGRDVGSRIYSNLPIEREWLMIMMMFANGKLGQNPGMA